MYKLRTIIDIVLRYYIHWKPTLLRKHFELRKNNLFPNEKIFFSIKCSIVFNRFNLIYTVSAILIRVTNRRFVFFINYTSVVKYKRILTTGNLTVIKPSNPRDFAEGDSLFPHVGDRLARSLAYPLQLWLTKSRCRSLGRSGETISLRFRTTRWLHRGFHRDAVSSSPSGRL